ncbi:MAG: hypothetical protein WAK17_03900 [Candidatus Nitrosopolaris sp.]
MVLSAEVKRINKYNTNLTSTLNPETQVDRILTNLVCFCNLSYYKVFALKSIKWFVTEEDDRIGSRMNDKQ